VLTGRGRLPREANDLALLALAAVIVPATWRLLLGWSWSDLIPGHDGVSTVFLAIRELVEAHGRWSDLVYRADLFGGMKVRDAVGPVPALALLARLPLSPTSVFNVLTFLIQIVIAFLGVRTAQDLAAVLAPGSRPATWLERAMGVWMCAFAPALAWRLGYGHHTLVVGGLPFLAALALLAASGAGTLGVTLLIVSTAALVNGVLFTGHQMVLYGVVFGGPILLGLWLTCGGHGRHLRVPVLVAGAAFLIALPGLWPVFAHAAGSDSLRSLGRMELTYSWLTSEPMDWLTSIPWTRLAVPFRRPVLFHHEINYAAGPLLALLALVPWRRARGLALGLTVSVVLVLLFSMNIQPFSRALLYAVPPLNSFRVPPRAILPALSLLPVLVLAAILSQAQARTRTGTALVALAAAGLFFLPSQGREAVGWTVALAVVALGPQGRRDLPALAWGALLVGMAAGSVAAFRERLLPFIPGQEALARAESVGAAALRAEPSLASPLVRASVGPGGRVRGQHRLRLEALLPRRLLLPEPPVRGAGLRLARPGLPAEPAHRAPARDSSDLAALVPALRRGLAGAGAARLGGDGGGAAADGDRRPRLVQRRVPGGGLVRHPGPRAARPRRRRGRPRPRGPVAGDGRSGRVGRPAAFVRGGRLRVGPRARGEGPAQRARRVGVGGRPRRLSADLRHELRGDAAGLGHRPGRRAASHGVPSLWGPGRGMGSAGHHGGADRSGAGWDTPAAGLDHCRPAGAGSRGPARPTGTWGRRK
jgi:hypothetical protein